MGKILVIPDVHLKKWIFDKAEELLKSVEVDNIVCLGDLVDDWDAFYNMNWYEETLQRALDFDKAHPQMLWCYGNHDVSYLWQKNETGYLPQARDIVCKYMNKLKEQAGNRLQFIHRIDTTVFSHAGVVQEFLDKYLNTDIVDKETVNQINNLGVSALWDEISPIWVRPQDTPEYSVLDIPVFQVVGHTPVYEATLTNNDEVLSLDTFSTDYYNTPIGNQRFIVVDTVTHIFEEM